MNFLKMSGKIAGIVVILAILFVVAMEFSGKYGLFMAASVAVSGGIVFFLRSVLPGIKNIYQREKEVRRKEEEQKNIAREIVERQRTLKMRAREIREIKEAMEAVSSLNAEEVKKIDDLSFSARISERLIEIFESERLKEERLVDVVPQIRAAGNVLQEASKTAKVIINAMVSLEEAKRDAKNRLLEIGAERISHGENARKTSQETFALGKRIEAAGNTAQVAVVLEEAAA